MRDIKLNLSRLAFAVLLASCGALWTHSLAAAASGDVGKCSPPLNISDSPGYTSADPFVLADPAGGAHLFWAERVLGQPNSYPDVPDTMMYSHYDGREWSTPVDLFVSPRNVFNRLIGGIKGVVDENGIIHLVWAGPDYRLYHSSAPADEAGSAHGWERPTLLSRDHSGTQYAADIAYTAPNTLHVLYGSGTGGGALDDNRTNRAISYIRSSDGGNNWTNPVDIYTFSSPANGGSNIRLLAGPDGALYAAWTEWDQSGNGRAIYFTRSLDNGRTWDEPVVLDSTVGDEYERDWTNLAILDRDRVVAMWEGGYRAYPQAQYSVDNGQSWSKPIDTFYWLIADNGPVQFVRDGANRLHAFLVRRFREGFEDRCDIYPLCKSWPTSNTIWHSMWEGDTNWREPKPVGNFVQSNMGGNYVSLAITQGNQLVSAWWGTGDAEIEVMQCEIEDAPSIAPIQRRTPTPTVAPTALDSGADLPSTPTPTPPPAFSPLPAQPERPGLSPGSMIVLGLSPALLLVALIVARRFLMRIRI